MGSCYIKDVLDVAREYIGYHEKGNNWTIFAQCLDKINYFNSPKQNVAWCSTFLNFCILKACIPADRSDSEKKWDALYFSFEPTRDNCACGVPYWKGYFKNNGALYSSPKVGDIAFIGSGHVGIVEKVNSSSKITTIEGNHGDAVARVTRNVSECTGFGRPRYDGYEPEPAPVPPTPEQKPYPGPWVDFPYQGRNYLQRYDEGKQVKNLQNFLVWLLGEDCLPRYHVDGEIGSETLGAVRQAQQFLNDALGCNLDVDGFYGIKTQEQAQKYKK